MNKTKAQRYNEMLDRIIDPEIKRLKTIEKVAGEILVELESKTTIDPCGLEKEQIINIISPVIKKHFIHLL